MKRDIRAYFEDIETIAAELQQATADHSRSDLDTNYLLRSAVEREFISIGEAVSQILKQRPECATRIRHAQQVIGFRNVLVHGYFALDQDVIWKTLQVDLPELVVDIRQLMIEFSSELD